MRLCGHLLERAEAAGAQLYVVFVSNECRQVPVWNQRLADSRDEPVLWDYHGECGGIEINTSLQVSRTYSK